MALLTIYGLQGPEIPLRIETTDDVLDRVADLLEDPPTTGGGFWLVDQLQVEREGVTTYADTELGHQRLWIPPGVLVRLVYDRPLSEDPDRLPDDDPRIVLL